MSSTAQILGVLGPVLSAVMDLRASASNMNNILWSRLPRYNKADSAQWCDILKPFNNVKSLLVKDGFIREISSALKVRHGESTVDLLPELKKLICSASVNADDVLDTFAAFIYARRHVGHPVTLLSG